MKTNSKSNSNMKSLQIAIQIFLWVGTTLLTIHSAVTQRGENYWIYRLVFGLIPCISITALSRIKNLSDKRKGLIFPLIAILGESLAAYFVGGDKYYFLLITACMMICILYFDSASGAICLLLTDIFVILFVYVFRLSLTANLSLYDTAFQFGLFNAIVICQIMFCRYSYGYFARAEKSGETFEAIMTMSPNYMMVIDESAKLAYVSDSLIKVMGISEKTLVYGKPLLDLFRDPKIKLFLNSIIETGGYWENDFDLVLNGEKRYFFGRSCLLGEGKIARLFEWSDITALVESRNEAIAASEAKSAFLANMSHEIRTPMNAIKSLSELMLLTKLDLVQKDYANNIVGASESLLRIINDVLDFSKIDAKKLNISVSKYDVVSFISDVLNITNLKAAEKGLQFVTDIQPSLPSSLLGDEVRIKQILLNLIGNAVKFTDTGFVKLSVREIRREDNKIFIEFKVKDTGIGIKKEDIEKLFDVFSQVDNIKNKSIEGTGLGLSISKRLVEMMNGTITMESEYGKGSVFSFIIPQEVCEEEPIAVVGNAGDIRMLLLGDGIKGEALCEIMQKLGIEYTYFDWQSKPDLAAIIAENSITDIIYFYQEWDKLLRQKSFYKSKKIRFIAIKDVRLVASQHTPSNFKFLFEPLLISHVAALLCGEETDTRTKIAPGEDSLGYFEIIDGKILVVDDNKVNLVVARSVFKHYNVAADCAESGADAVLMCQNKKYDIIFMDHMMPGMDGIEATSAILSGKGPNSTTPIVALTANVVSGMREVFLENGMLDFIGKPMEIRELNRILKRFIPKDRLSVNYIADLESRVPDNNNQQIFIDFMEIGIDYRSALNAIGGNEAVYLGILETFSDTVPDKLKVLSALLRGYENGDADTNLFRIEIHALKSAFANIGGAVLSQKAKALEMNSCNKSFVLREFPEFYSEATKLLSGIQKFVPKVVSAESEPKKDGNFSALNKSLEEIKDYLNRLESEDAEKEIMQLQSFSYGAKIDSLLEYVRGAVQNFRIDEAFEAINDIIKALEQDE